MDRCLVKYDAMLNAIAECYRIDEVREIRNTAIALAAYAKQAQNFDAERQAVEIRVRAERRAGELLKLMSSKCERQARGQDQKSKSHKVTSIPTLSDLGISKFQSSVWQQLANIPEDKFELALTCQKPLSAVSIIKVFEKSMPQSEDWWKEYWHGMPEFVQEDLRPYRTLHVHFKSQQDVEEFLKRIGQKIGPKTRTIWFPAAPAPDKVKNLRWVSRSRN